MHIECTLCTLRISAPSFKCVCAFYTVNCACGARGGVGALQYMHFVLERKWDVHLNSSAFMHFLQVQPVCAPIFLYRQVKETFFPNFSEIPSVLETPPVPKVVLFGGYCDYYGVHHPVTRGKPIPPPLIVFAPILIILTFPDANDRDLPSPNNNMNFPSFQWWWRHHSWNAYHAGVHYSWNFLSKMMSIRYG